MAYKILFVLASLRFCFLPLVPLPSVPQLLAFLRFLEHAKLFISHGLCTCYFPLPQCTPFLHVSLNDTSSVCEASSDLVQLKCVLPSYAGSISLGSLKARYSLIL